MTPFCFVFLIAAAQMVGWLGSKGGGLPQFAFFV